MSGGNAKIVRTTWRGFRVCALNAFPDSGGGYEESPVELFRRLLLEKEARAGTPPPAWTDLTIRKRAESHTWKVPRGNGADGKFVVFKEERNLARRSLDRWCRLLFVSAESLMKRVVRAHEAGFAFPMRIFLVAERKRLGWLRERFVLAEFIEGKHLSPPSVAKFIEGKPEVLDAVKTAHRFGLTWGGDPNPLNFLRQSDGALRGIDFSYKRATWKRRGKDLLRLERCGVSLGNAGFRTRFLKLMTRIFCVVERNATFGKISRER